jgi:hypothetical protein
MLPQPTFDNDYLRESLYEAVLSFLPNGLSVSTQNILSQCVFGIVPSPYQVRTVLIIAPCLELAEDLLLDIDCIKARVMYLMPDIGQIGICVEPIANEMADLEPTSQQIFPATSPQYLMGRFFLLSRENN